MKNTFKETIKAIATDEKLHTSLLYSLSRMTVDSLEIFKQEWPEVSIARRQEIIRELIEIAETNFEVDFTPIFLLGLADIDETVRASSLKGLWGEEDTALIKPLIYLFQTDEAPSVRAAAATTLGQYIYLSEIEEIPAEAVEPIKEALLEAIYQADEAVDVRRRAIEAIAYLGDDNINPIIENAYYDSNEKFQISAVFAMGRNGDAKWKPIVLDELSNPNSEIRFEAARSCGELEMNEAVEKLITLISDDADLEVQEMAIWSLGRIGGSLAREALAACIEGDNESLAVAAEAALEELNLFSGDWELFDFDETDGEFDDMLLDFDDLNGSNNQQGYLH
ncbi:MAG: HEAT repeat domain-containing protein [Chloroflexota bacterium]